MGSSSLIAKVLWKSEPEGMAEEVSGVRSSIVSCPSPSYSLLALVCRVEVFWVCMCWRAWVGPARFP